MCGIVGYIGNQESSSILLAGLRELEYRGYDSAGIALLEAGGAFRCFKAVGKLENLVAKVGDYRSSVSAYS
jgi:glucosamine--fructose-6-phosphate aminotransferase (isomerizing)